MKNITIAGRVGKDAETRSTQGGTQVTSWSVAVDDGWGENKSTIWFDCAMWGDRGSKVARFISKGTPVTVSGDLTKREHDGKTYIGVRVADVTLQGKSESQGGGGSSSPPASGGGYGGGDMDDEIPFAPEFR